MAGERVLSQEEIDSVFRNLRDKPREDDIAKRAQPYDFRRPDRIAKDQLRAIHVLHENFARSLASSLSAYLRAYVAVKTDPLRDRIALSGRLVEVRKHGYAEWQLLEEG